MTRLARPPADRRTSTARRPGRWTYRVRLSANWLNEPRSGTSCSSARRSRSPSPSEWPDWRHLGIAWPRRLRGWQPSGRRRTGTRGSGPSIFCSARTCRSTSVSPGRLRASPTVAAFPARRSVRSPLPRRARFGRLSGRRPARVLRRGLRPARSDGLSGRPSDRAVRSRRLEYAVAIGALIANPYLFRFLAICPGRLADSVFMLGGLVALLGLLRGNPGSWSGGCAPPRWAAARPSSRSSRSRRSACSYPATGARKRSAGADRDGRVRVRGPDRRLRAHPAGRPHVLGTATTPASSR